MHPFRITVCLSVLTGLMLLLGGAALCYVGVCPCDDSWGVNP